MFVFPATFSNIFPSEDTWPIKLKFHIETGLAGGMSVCLNGPDHMIVMVDTLIYGKNPLKSSTPKPEGQ